MQRRAQIRILLLITTTAIMLACMPTFAPASAPIPTFDPNSLSTAIAETANAASTQTALFTTPTLTPTLTPTASKTPTETPTPSATFVFVIYSPTATSISTSSGKPATPYACTILSQFPENNSSVSPSVNFSVRWQVKNSGSSSWDTNATDYRYKSGAKIHKQPAYDLYKTVSPEENADIIVDMQAPTKLGKYSTTWVIRSGKTEFCKLSLTIEVK